MTVQKLYEHIGRHIKLRDEEERELFQQFLLHNFYVQGKYDDDNGFLKLMKRVCELEDNDNGLHANRLFYLALPPNIFQSTTKLIKQHCWNTKYVILDFYCLFLISFSFSFFSNYLYLLIHLAPSIIG